MFQIQQLGDSLKSGDVILSNHPQAGGSHLPDLTVITPVSSCLMLSPLCHTDVTALCPRARQIIPCLELVQSRKTCPNMTETMLTGT